MLSSLLTPRQAAELLGVSESTVRRWCDSGALLVSRTTGRHRRIDRNAVLEFARRQGLLVVSPGVMTTAGHGGRLPRVEELCKRFYQQLVGGDDDQAQEFVLEFLDRTGAAATLCDEVIAPAMHRIGAEWSKGIAPIHLEHAATQCSEHALAVAQGHVARSDSAGLVAVCAGLPADPYSLAPSMCSLVLKSIGFRIVLLGPNTPAEEILAAARARRAVLIAASLGAEPSSPDALASLCRLAEQSGIRVALGGRALTPELRRQLNPDFFGDTMAHLVHYGERLRKMLVRDGDVA